MDQDLKHVKLGFFVHREFWEKQKSPLGVEVLRGGG